MRLDKYLKVSRLIKRRTVANEACTQGRVLVNGKVAKPSAEITEGDTITLQMGNRALSVKVISMQEHAAKTDASALYTLLEESK